MMPRLAVTDRLRSGLVRRPARTGDGPAKFHVDFHTDDVEAEVARLESLGARRVEKVKSWWVMRDPVGLPFCVVPDPPGSLTDANAQRWD